MTDERKQELRKLCEAASLGPWIRGQEGNLRVYGRDYSPDAGLVASVMRAKDVALITASRAALPDLLAALDAANARAESLAGQVGEMRNGLHAHLSEDCEQCRRLLAQPPSALEAKYAAAIALAENCDDRKNGYTVEWLERHEELLAHYRAAKEAGNV